MEKEEHDVWAILLFHLFFRSYVHCGVELIVLIEKQFSWTHESDFSIYIQCNILCGKWAMWRVSSRIEWRVVCLVLLSAFLHLKFENSSPKLQCCKWISMRIERQTQFNWSLGMNVLHIFILYIKYIVYVWKQQIKLRFIRFWYDCILYFVPYTWENKY